jgi:DNA topoisomerase-3
MTLLCVAEKPSVARTAASILSSGRASQENTRDQYVKNIVFRGTFLGQDMDIVFTSVLGHLYEMEFAPQYESWTAVEPGSLFSAQIVHKIPDKFKDLRQNLGFLSRRARHLMLWLDNDREGENISEEVEKLCKSANPQLQVYRTRFSALSPADLWRALENPDQINRLDSRAVELRRELDLRTGSAFTRFQTLRFRPFTHDARTLISYGPCQFPTLGFVVDAYVKRKNFVPERFWLLNCTIRKDDTTCALKWCRKRLFCKISCFALYASVLDDPRARVTNVREERKLKWKPLPLATVEFQRRVSKYLKIEPHEAMRIAEKLYSSGYISYPRTETDSFPDNFDFASIVHILAGYDEVAEYATSLRVDRPRKGRNSDNAHPPIYPLKVPDGQVTNDERRIYRFIAHHYLACCSSDAVGFETLVLFDVGDESFKLKGLRVAERNWLDIYTYIRGEGNVIPGFGIGEEFQPVSVKMNEKETTAPGLLTEPQLIAKMDQEGIGTDATIAEHIKTIQDRGYSEKASGAFVPLPIGLALVLGYEGMGFDFAKPKLRADTERTMQDISAGRSTYDRERRRLINKYEDAYERVKQLAFMLDKSFQKQITENLRPAIHVQPAERPPRGARTARGGAGRGRGRGRAPRPESVNGHQSHTIFDRVGTF